MEEKEASLAFLSYLPEAKRNKSEPQEKLKAVEVQLKQTLDKLDDWHSIWNDYFFEQ